MKLQLLKGCVTSLNNVNRLPLAFMTSQPACGSPTPEVIQNLLQICFHISGNRGFDANQTFDPHAEFIAGAQLGQYFGSEPVPGFLGVPHPQDAALFFESPLAGWRTGSDIGPGTGSGTGSEVVLVGVVALSAVALALVSRKTLDSNMISSGGTGSAYHIRP